MPTTTVDGIVTRYEVIGSGPPLLLFSPGGFNAVAENWSTLGRYRDLRLLDHLADRYTCITFDRRESGRSGGRVERVTWADYVAQGKGLLDHLEIERAHLMGGCAGCSTAAAFAVAHPRSVATMVMFSPAGGAQYRIKQHARFVQHLAYVEQEGLDQVVALANSHDLGFTSDPRVGPWVSVIRGDPAFATVYAKQDLDRYRYLVGAMVRLQFDRDTVPGAEAEDLLQLDIPALIVPGQDTSHATSGARYLEECLSASEYWDVPVADQTREAVAARILEFLDAR